MLKATMPIQAGNDLVKSPSMGQKMETLLGDLKPEAVYYTLDKGQRTIYFVVSMDSSSELPSKLEPVWHTFNADIELIPAMNQDDFNTAMQGLGQVMSKY